MSPELTARTESGRRLVELAEAMAADFATRAAAHDRDASFPCGAIEALAAAGYLRAPVPVERGGLGVDSVHDLVVASSRLARGDASVAIGVNMHLALLVQITRRLRIAEAAGDARRAAAFGEALDAIVREGIVLAAAVSERGQDLLRPGTRAVRTERGWRIDGTKIFCTMSPAATHLYTAVGFTDERGVERYGYAQIPVDTPGVVLQDDWDAMGMRASGSQSVALEGVEVPAEALPGGFRAGEPVLYMERNLVAGLFHASASVGIAEASLSLATATRRNGRPPSSDPRSRMVAAEGAIELSACRAVLARAATVVDEHFAANPASVGSDEDTVAVFAEAQAAKAFCNEAATRVVDRALALSGGAGYMNGSPLARAYRDVRAGAFMHPLGANRAYDLVGSVTLGLEPELR